VSDVSLNYDDQAKWDCYGLTFSARGRGRLADGGTAAAPLSDYSPVIAPFPLIRAE
jgi:hypothetical protein